MKKICTVLCLCLLPLLLFSSCDSGYRDFPEISATPPAEVPPTETPDLTEAPAVTEEPTASGTPTVTDVPVTTEAPTATETPAVTDVPVATEAPTATETPAVTDVPAATEAPVATETPEATATPTATEAPKATEAPMPTEALKATATPAPTATPTPTKAPAKLDTITYTFNDMLYLTSYDTNYFVQNDGSIDLQFDGKWKEIKFTLPDSVDLNYCERVTVKAKSEYANLTVKLYDEAILADAYCGEVFRKYDCMGNGVIEYELIPDVFSTIHGIGLMSLDEVADNSKYKATVYSITFHMMSGYDSPSQGNAGSGVSDDATLLNTYGNVFGKMGTCINLWQLQNNSTLNLVKSQYNSVTSENEMKPDALLGYSPSLISVDEAKKLGYVIPDNYKESTVPKLNFGNVDKTLELCAKNNLSYRAHTLVWHSQTPEWFFRSNYSGSASYVSKEIMNARMEFYIRTVMSHVYNSEYGYVVYSWDVVNEYLHADQIPNWINIYGGITTSPDYVKLAYTIADDVLKQYGIRDKVSLIFNDYNTYINTHKYLSIMEFINSDGKVCDGFGMQAHLDTGYPTASAFKNTVTQFLATGLEVQITELDVTTKSAATQERYYYELMSYLLELQKNGGKITGLTFWGLGDSNSWRGDRNPLLFSAPGKPKEVYYKVLQAYSDAGYPLN